MNSIATTSNFAIFFCECLMNFSPDFAPNSRKEWRLLLLQSNLRTQVRKLPKILTFVRIKFFAIIQNYSLVSLDVLARPQRARPAPLWPSTMVPAADPWAEPGAVSQRQQGFCWSLAGFGFDGEKWYRTLVFMFHAYPVCRAKKKQYIGLFGFPLQAQKKQQRKRKNSFSAAAARGSSDFSFPWLFFFFWLAITLAIRSSSKSPMIIITSSIKSTLIPLRTPRSLEAAPEKVRCWTNYSFLLTSK